LKGTPIENRLAAEVVVSHYLRKMLKEGKLKEDGGLFQVTNT